MKKLDFLSDIPEHCFDWNVLLNNVSHSVTSSIRKNIQYIYGTTGSITSSAELQDSYLSLNSYVTSRYNGSQVTSLKYNTYTPSSSIWPGDDSYGKTAAIDHNSYKIGWVKNIPSQSLNFYDKTQIQLKYLVDKGISPERIKLKAWGSSRPVSSNLIEEKRKFNRRVEFTLLDE